MSEQGRYGMLGRELLDGVASHASNLLCTVFSMSKDTADIVGNEIAIELAKAWGGQMVYVPATIPRELLERDRKIWDDFDGKNYPELSRKYGLTLTSVYRIIGRVRKEDAAHRQRELPI